MKVYDVEITGHMEVQAETPDEAREKAKAEIGRDARGFEVGYVMEIQDLGDQE